jgi:tetratricopeptide (TPR) repeat protein
MKSNNHLISTLLAGLLLLLVTGCQPFFFFGTFGDSYASNLKQAEELTRQKEFKKAIEQYLAHVQKRLELETRPEWENPYFYYILIADLHLKLDQVPEALESLETAEKEGVEKGLLSDRFRYIANWLTEKKRHKEALEVLEKYRDRDPLLFDLSLDRIARELTKIEEEKTEPE